MRTKITSILGALIAVFGALSQPDILAILPARWSVVLSAVGIILAALGRSLLAPTNAPPPNDSLR